MRRFFPLRLDPVKGRREPAFNWRIYEFHLQSKALRKAQEHQLPEKLEQTELNSNQTEQEWAVCLALCKSVSLNFTENVIDGSEETFQILFRSGLQAVIWITKVNTLAVVS